jgi:hypothetical protein
MYSDVSVITGIGGFTLIPETSLIRETNRVVSYSLKSTIDSVHLYPFDYT